MFRFVWFDMDNMNDSTWVDILFDSQVGIDENAAGVTDSRPSQTRHWMLNEHPGHL
ncbi:MAG: hypothetical protein IPH05_12565 [Flavobacteriales bacterium]|nr:hypothetical protein [Flavobacteriales bacterium]